MKFKTVALAVLLTIGKSHARPRESPRFIRLESNISVQDFSGVDFTNAELRAFSHLNEGIGEMSRKTVHRPKLIRTWSLQDW